jgi:hypothetical protein
MPCEPVGGWISPDSRTRARAGRRLAFDIHNHVAILHPVELVVSARDLSAVGVDVVLGDPLAVRWTADALDAVRLVKLPAGGAGRAESAVLRRLGRRAVHVSCSGRIVSVCLVPNVEESCCERQIQRPPPQRLRSQDLRMVHQQFAAESHALKMPRVLTPHLRTIVKARECGGRDHDVVLNEHKCLSCLPWLAEQAPVREVVATDIDAQCVRCMLAKRRIGFGMDRSSVWADYAHLPRHRIGNESVERRWHSCGDYRGRRQGDLLLVCGARYRTRKHFSAICPPVSSGRGITRARHFRLLG